MASQLGRADADASQQLAGLSFLDLFAGSGAVGLEAYSRGAQVTWVDIATARVIERNLHTLDAQGTVVASEVSRFLQRRPQPFDIVWMDPPYEMGNAQISRLLTLIDSRGWVSAGGSVLVERGGNISAVEFPESFPDVHPKRFGGTIIYCAKKGIE